MYSLGIICSCLSVIILYTRAKNTEYQAQRKFILKGIAVLRRYPIAGNLIALVFFILSTMILIREMGVAAGIFTSIALWMLIAGLMTLFAPLEKVKTRHLLLLMMSLPALEYFLRP